MNFGGLYFCALSTLKERKRWFGWRYIHHSTVKRLREHIVIHTQAPKEKRKKMSEYVHRGAYTPYFLNIQSECLAVPLFSAQFNEAENKHAIINAYE